VVVTGTLLAGCALDVVVVVARVVVVAGVVFVAGVVAARVVGVSVGAAAVAVVWRAVVVVVAAVVGGIVDVGAAVAAVVGVTRREEGGRLDVAMVEFTVSVDRCAAPFPLGPMVRAKAVTSATAPTVAPTMATLLRLSDSASVIGSPAIGAGGAHTGAATADSGELATMGESDHEGSVCGCSLLSVSPGSCGTWWSSSTSSLVTGPAASGPAGWRSSWPRYAAGYEMAAVESKRGLSSGAHASCDVLPASLTRRVGFPSREK
jgi:hypothetical protein